MTFNENDFESSKDNDMTQETSTPATTAATTAATTPATTNPESVAQPRVHAGEAKPSHDERDLPAMLPAVDVVEDATGLTLWVDMPGVPKEAIELHLDGDSLSIAGSIAALDTPGMRPLYAEVRAGRYRRAFTLSRELETSRIEANSKNGVLQLRIPKSPAVQPRRIEVRAA